jgi:hypothetical protein
MKKFYFAIILMVIGFSVTFLMNSCSKSSNPADNTPSPLATVGQLTLSTNSIIVNQSASIIIRLNVPFGTTLSDSVITLWKVNSVNERVDSLGQLLDNGSLYNGDDIKGDNVFSGKISFTETSAGVVRLMAFGKIASKLTGSELAMVQVYNDLTPQMYDQVMNLQNAAATQLNTLLGGNQNNAEAAANQLKTWLLSQIGVASVEKSGNTSMLINYTNGLKGGLIISLEDDYGYINTRGGYSSISSERRKSPSTPLNKQTVGIPAELGFSKPYFTKNATLPSTVVGNRNVLIYGPFEAAFAPYNEAANIIARLNLSSCKGFNITHLSNQSANIAALNDLAGYGYVVLATHGSQGKSFATGEVVDTTLSVYQTTYKAMLLSGKLAIWKNMTISKAGAVKVKNDIYAVTASFISGLSGTFQNSIILNNSCESTMNPDLENAFIAKGAKTYYGYTKVVNSGFCVSVADTVTKRLAKDNQNTGQAYWNASDPSSPNAQFQIKGANDMIFSADLVNGNFEAGNLEGWSKEGDGRVISQLGFLSPPQGSAMGIISSGLGYTAANGSISQCVNISQTATTLKVKWNFLSEEFLEWIGSNYQDYFTIEIIKDDGSVVYLYSRTIDGFATEYGATTTDPGQLIGVSPGIVFDKTSVYMTGWNSSEFDVTAYRGTTITIVFLIGDVGDSIYDSACLLDDISIQ